MVRRGVLRSVDPMVQQSSPADLWLPAEMGGCKGWGMVMGRGLDTTRGHQLAPLAKIPKNRPDRYMLASLFVSIVIDHGLNLSSTVIRCKMATNASYMSSFLPKLHLIAIQLPTLSVAESRFAQLLLGAITTLVLFLYFFHISTWKTFETQRLDRKYDRVPPLLPYTIPFVGSAIGFALNPAKCLAKASSVKTSLPQHSIDQSLAESTLQKISWTTSCLGSQNTQSYIILFAWI